MYDCSKVEESFRGSGHLGRRVDVPPNSFRSVPPHREIKVMDVLHLGVNHVQVLILIIRYGGVKHINRAERHRATQIGSDLSVGEGRPLGAVENRPLGHPHIH